MPGERIGNSNQYLTISGVVSAPAYSWASDNNTGLYRIGADNIGVAANGAKVLDIATTGLTVTGAFASSNGVSSTLTTDATSSSTGSIITAGGISCQKSAVVGVQLGVGAAPSSEYVGADPLLQITGGTAQQGALSLASTRADAANAVVGSITIQNSTNTATYKTIAALYGRTQPSGTANRRGGYFSFLLQPDNTAGLTEYMQLTTTGLGIGMTPTAGYGALQAYTGAGGTQIGIGLAATVGLLNYFGNDFQISSNATLNSAGAWTARYTAAALMELRGDGSIVFQSNTGLTAGNSFSPTEHARFDTSGRLCVGGTTAEGFFTLNKASPTNGRIAVFTNGVDTNIIFPLSSGSSGIGCGTNTPFLFYVNGTERARFDTNGDLLIGTTTSSTVGYGSSIVGISRIAGSTSTNLNLGTTAAAGSVVVNMAQQFIPSVDNTNNCGFSGGYRWAAVYAANGTIQTSDARQKNSITNSVLGLDFIMALRPVSYKWNIGGNTLTYDKDQNPIVTPKEGKRTHFGFVAQEVKEALGEQDFGGYLETSDGSLALRYDQFIAPLTAAIQELTTRLAALEAK